MDEQTVKAHVYYYDQQIVLKKLCWLYEFG